VVLSTDAHNDRPGSWPVCAYITRRPAVPTAFQVTLIDPDPVGGAVDVATAGPFHPEWFKQPVGILTGATLARVADALRGFLEV
jgi:mRNA interferase MazF